VAFYHVRSTLAGPVRCPGCGSGRDTPTVAFHSWRPRTVEHLGVEQPTYLVLPVPKYACRAPACPRKYFMPPVAEVAPRARTSRRLQQTAVRRYRRGTAALRAVETELREDFHTGTGKSSVLRWHQQTLATDCPRPERLPFSGVLCIDEVYDRVDGKRVPTWTCVDPLAGITVRIPIDRADAVSLAAAMQQVKAFGADPKVIVSDLWAAYPEALAQVWPRAERQLCWFHVMQWTTRTLGELLKAFGETLPEADRTALHRLRFRLLACPETLERQRQAGRIGARTEQALARAWDLLRGTVVEEALQLRNDLRAVLNQSTSRREARARFTALRQAWPAPFRPRRGWLDGWRPGQPLPPKPPKPARPAPPADDLYRYLHELMAFFIRHFEQMITYLDHPGVPRTNNHSERANRRYRATSRPRYGWKTNAGHRAMLVALQGFDTS
jgi:transposase-like protein